MYNMGLYMLPSVHMLHCKWPCICAFVQRISNQRPVGHSKRFTVFPNIHPFIHTFTQRRRCQPRRATASRSGAVRVRDDSLRGHLLHTPAKEEPGNRTSNLLVTSQPAVYLLRQLNNHNVHEGAGRGTGRSAGWTNAFIRTGGKLLDMKC